MLASAIDKSIFTDVGELALLIVDFRKDCKPWLFHLRLSKLKAFVSPVLALLLLQSSVLY